MDVGRRKVLERMFKDMDGAKKKKEPKNTKAVKKMLRGMESEGLVKEGRKGEFEPVKPRKAEKYKGSEKPRKAQKYEGFMKSRSAEKLRKKLKKK